MLKHTILSVLAFSVLLLGNALAAEEDLIAKGTTMLRDDLEHPAFDIWGNNKPGDKSFQGMSYLLEARRTDPVAADQAIATYFKFDPKTDTPKTWERRQKVQQKMGLAWTLFWWRLIGDRPLLEARIVGEPKYNPLERRPDYLTRVWEPAKVEVIFAVQVRYAPGYLKALEAFSEAVGSSKILTDLGWKRMAFPDALGGSEAERYFLDHFHGRVSVVCLDDHDEALGWAPILWASQVGLGTSFSPKLETWQSYKSWSMPIVKMDDVKRIHRSLAYYDQPLIFYYEGVPGRHRNPPSGETINISHLFKIITEYDGILPAF